MGSMCSYFSPQSMGLPESVNGPDGWSAVATARPRPASPDQETGWKAPSARPVSRALTKAARRISSGRAKLRVRRAEIARAAIPPSAALGKAQVAAKHSAPTAGLTVNTTAP